MLEDLAQDILDLGLNAASAQASEVSVRLLEDDRTDRLTLIVADNGDGMSPELQKRVLEGFQSTKSGARKPLGLGIAMLREASELCEGRFRLRSRPGKGTVVAATMKRSHIDRPPLGDIAGSVSALCCAEGGMGVRFEHRRGDDVVKFDSRDYLGPVSRNGGIPALKLMEIEKVLEERERALCALDS